MQTNVDNPVRPSVAPPKRRLRNYLLDSRFQFKYTGMVVFVTVVVAGVLGTLAYYYSHGQTEALTIQMAMQPDLSPDVARSLQEFAEEEDRRVLTRIIAGILVLTFALGLTGIVVTHKLVGPAYKMKRLIGEIAKGHLKVESGLRKGDELHDVFESFSQMVASLRARHEKQIADLDAAITHAAKAGMSPESLSQFQRIREDLQRELS